MSFAPNSTRKLRHDTTWVREYLSRQDGSECDESLREAFDDLQATVAAMFDSEIARRVREVETKGYYEEVNFLPGEHSPEIQEPSRSESEAELKPQPLFVSQQVVTYGGDIESYPSSSRSSTERSPGSSLNIVSPGTSMTTSSPKMAPNSPILDDDFIKESDNAVMPLTQRENSARTSVADRSTFPPRRSSMQAKADMELFSSTLPVTSEKSPSRLTQPCTPATPLKETKRTVTYPSRTLFNSKLSSSRPLPPFYVEAAEALLQRATSMAQLSISSQGSHEQISSSSTANSSLFKKVWTPPPYNPNRSRSPSPPQTPPSNGFGAVQQTFDKFRYDRIGLKRSTSTSSLTIASPKDSLFSIISRPITSSQPVQRNDSFSFVSTPSRRHSPPFKPRPKNQLNMGIPTQLPVLPGALGAGPKPSEGQLMMEIEDGLKALRYTDGRETQPPKMLSVLQKPIKRQGSIRRIASAASGQLQRHFSSTFNNNETRSSTTSHSSSSPSWITVFPSAQPELIVDPNGLLSSLHPHPNKSAALTSSSNTALPLDKPLHTKRPQAEMAKESTKPDAIPGYRPAMEVDRQPEKAVRVLGPFNTWKDIEARLKAKEDKERKRAKKKRRFNEILEVASKALELG